MIRIFSLILLSFSILFPIRGETQSLETTFSVSARSGGTKRVPHGFSDGRSPVLPYALVIGVAHYTYFPDLPNSIENAEKMASFLRASGYEVRLLSDPSLKEMTSEFGRIKDSVGRDEERNILIYFSGYGETQSTLHSGRVGWLLPADCPQRKKDPHSFEMRGINTLYIEELLRNVRSRHVMLLLDTSISSSLFHPEKPVLYPLSERIKKKARHFFIAGSADEPIPDKSVFTDNIIRALKGDADALKDGIVTGAELGVYLSNRALRDERHHQTIQIAKMKGENLSGGEYCFKVFPRETSGTLTVKAIPRDAEIKIVSGKQRFEQKLPIQSGKYQIEVSARGYSTHVRWANVRSGEDTVMTVRLSRKKMPL